MNAEWLGDWKLGPRAHPGDGLVDVTIGALGWRDRWRASRRAPHGDHVPHPRLAVTRSASAEVHFLRPTPVWVDGEPAGRVARVVLTVEPDAAVIVV
jgi:diacylglycerol kinase family enzyme